MKRFPHPQNEDVGTFPVNLSAKDIRRAFVTSSLFPPPKQLSYLYNRLHGLFYAEILHKRDKYQN